MAPQADPPARPYGRRAFLVVVAVGSSSLAWGDWARSSVSLLPQPVTASVPGLDAFPSPTGGCRIHNVNPPMPTFDRASWGLRIEGLVERPVELSHEQVRELPRAEQVSDFGWNAEDVRWPGVRFRDLVRSARPLPGAKAVAFISAERPYVDTLTLEQALVPDAMLAYEMDGEPPSRTHGEPARFVIPEMYGYRNVARVERIVLGDDAFDGYWEQRGYDRNAWVGRSSGYG